MDKNVEIADFHGIATNSTFYMALLLWNCHEFHVLHGSAFMESVDTCENHVFPCSMDNKEKSGNRGLGSTKAWKVRKTSVSLSGFIPRNCGKLGKPV